MRVPIPFKFIHAADLHLDSPFRVHEGKNEELRSLLLSASLKAFSQLCDVAIDQKVDFIVLAGDTYDGIEHGARAQFYMRREILRLGTHGVTVFMAFGNHDPVNQGQEMPISWPDNLIRFGPEPQTFALKRGEVTYGEITGMSYATREEKRNLAQLFPESSTDLFSIAVMHSNVGGSKEHDSYAPAAISDLIGKGYDYWALGHIHKRTVLCDDPLVLYPGNIQGLHMKPSERGIKGAELVEVGTGGVNHRFIPLSQIIFDLVEVDISGCGTLDAVVEACLDSIQQKLQEGEGRPLVARVVLSGLVSVDLDDLGGNLDAIHSELLAETAGLLPATYVDQVEGDLTLPRTLGEFSALSDVVGELIREVGEWRSDQQKLNGFSIERELRNNLASRLKRAGLDQSLSASEDDLDAAESLLAQLFGGGRPA
ncbi:MAG: DNA repair exonuclease [Actinomycetota bacterium]|nr:MAG: DNA repair exonuclease [Actinomycetota bacterium]